MLLLVTKELIEERTNEVHRLLLFIRVAGPAGRRDCSFSSNVKDEGTVNPSSMDLG